MRSPSSYSLALRLIRRRKRCVQRLGVIKTVFDVNKHIEPKYILSVMKTYPDLFFRPAAHSRGRRD